MISRKNNKSLIGGDRDQSIMRSNDQILRMAAKGYYLPGKGPDNYVKQVEENNKMLLDSTIERQNEIKQNRVEQKIDQKPGFFDFVLNTAQATLGFGNNSISRVVAKKSGSAIYDTFDSILSAPRYLMIFAGLVLLIMLIRK